LPVQPPHPERGELDGVGVVHHDRAEIGQPGQVLADPPFLDPAQHLLGLRFQRRLSQHVLLGME
jgi:hypothetical protein